MKPKGIQVIGHRGDRGNFPENSIPAFLSAVAKGVHSLEMDVVITKDHQVLVSHEPFMASVYVLTPSGLPIVRKEERRYNCYQMHYDSIKAFDAGSKFNPRFPYQQLQPTHKPLLAEVMNVIEKAVQRQQDKPTYTIELKSSKRWYEKFQPKPKQFVDLVMQVIDEQKLPQRVILQSFDRNVLEFLHRDYPHIRLAYLTTRGDAQKNLPKISFQPDIYSPPYRLVEKDEVRLLQAKGMQCIPWTVNEPTAINQLLRFGVDGIITDYPERVFEQIKHL